MIRADCTCDKSHVADWGQLGVRRSKKGPSQVCSNKTIEKEKTKKGQKRSGVLHGTEVRLGIELELLLASWLTAFQQLASS